MKSGVIIKHEGVHPFKGLWWACPLWTFSGKEFTYIDRGGQLGRPLAIIVLVLNNYSLAHNESVDAALVVLLLWVLLLLVTVQVLGSCPLGLSPVVLGLLLLEIWLPAITKAFYYN